MKIPLNSHIVLVERDKDSIPSIETTWDSAGNQKGAPRCESAHVPLKSFLFVRFLSKTDTERLKNFLSNGP